MRFTALLILSALGLAAQVGIGSPSRPYQMKPEDLCGVQGRISNASTGAAVRKATVLLLRTDGAASGMPPAQSYNTATDAAGSFAIKGIEPGSYRMTVRRNGFVSIAYGARGPSRLGTILTLNLGQTLNVDLGLTPYGAVAGRILDEDGEAVPHVSVDLLRFQYEQGKKQLMNAGSASTNDLGEYRIFEV